MGVFQKPENSGIWWVDYYNRNTGRRHREKVGTSEKLAKDVLSKRKLEIAEDKFFPQRQRNRSSFKDFAEKYWNLYGKLLKSRFTAGLHKKALGAFGAKPLTNITAEDVRNFYNTLLEGRSPATANRYLCYLQSMFSRAIEWEDYRGTNPVSVITVASPDNHSLRFLSKEEIVALLANCSDRVRPILSFALLTGMRLGEMLGLNWKQIDQVQWIIYLEKTKSGKMREFPVGARLYDLLQALGPKKEGKVFEIPAITLRRHFKDALDKAKITNFRFHDLRHTFASHFLMETGDLPALQDLLGHASGVMSRRYAHLAKGHLVKDLRTFENAIPIGYSHPGGHQAIPPTQGGRTKSADYQAKMLG